MLEPGDRVSNFFLECQSGEIASLYDKALGCALVVLFIARVRSEAGERRLRETGALFTRPDGPPVHLIVFTRDVRADASAVCAACDFPGWIFCEEDDRAANAFGCDWSLIGDGVQTLVLDANQRLLCAFAADGEDPVERAARYVRSLPVVAAREVAHAAPILGVPRVFDSDFCQRLINAFHSQGHEEGGVYAVREGELVHRVDESIKKRQDHYVRDSDLGSAIGARLMRRVLPEIQKVFHYTVTAAEEYKVVRYRGEQGGYFGAHRDDMSPQTAHRRFAITLNLNAAYEGGHLRFPEYGPHLYRPGVGEAVVFSCSLLHQVLPVTQGDRYVLLAFLYGEDGKRQRQEIEALMARTAEVPGTR
jgi:predicted 2-oxoglutarate/Fe(II)-dependent dioxygenase YbiX